MTIRDDGRALGQHWLLECYGPLSTYTKDQLSGLMHGAADAGGATVLMCHMHEFKLRELSESVSEPLPEQPPGVTGVLMLAESHISVHTWPENNYAAFDIFMCQGSNPDAACEFIKQACAHTKVFVRCVHRGNRDAFFQDGCQGGDNS